MSTLFLKGASTAVWHRPPSPPLFNSWLTFTSSILKTLPPPVTLVWDGDPVEGSAFSYMLPELLFGLRELSGSDGLKLVKEVKAYRLMGKGEELGDNLREVYESRGLGEHGVNIVETEVVDTWPSPNPYIALGWRSLNSVPSGCGNVKVVCLGGGPTVQNEFKRAEEGGVAST
ncbi:hypothetical protein TrRE_jg7144, partial [Triparma retinervis]